MLCAWWPRLSTTRTLTTQMLAKAPSNHARRGLERRVRRPCMQGHAAAGLQSARCAPAAAGRLPAPKHTRDGPRTRGLWPRRVARGSGVPQLLGVSSGCHCRGEATALGSAHDPRGSGGAGCASAAGVRWVMRSKPSLTVLFDAQRRGISNGCRRQFTATAAAAADDWS